MSWPNGGKEGLRKNLKSRRLCWFERWIAVAGSVSAIVLLIFFVAQNGHL